MPVEAHASSAPRAPFGTLLPDLDAALSAMPHGLSPGDGLARLIDAGLDRLPLPGDGNTLQRWQALAMVAHHDLRLLKLYEGHTDALAILAELDGPRIPGAVWGVWCAEPPGVAVQLQGSETQGYRVAGRKQWCSGAAVVSHALVSCRNARDERCLAAVALRGGGAVVTGDGWHAVGMDATGSVDVEFLAAPAVPVAAPGAYLARPGFWHGGAGIAASWHGAARYLADVLSDTVRRAEAREADPHRLAHLGHGDIALAGAAALLRETAAWIDVHPAADAAVPVMRVRLAVEAAATSVLEHVTRALGAGPLCRDARFARMAADLPVFLRQSHAERDLAALGGMLARHDRQVWAL